MAPTPPLLSWIAHLLQLPEEMDEMKIQLLEMRNKVALTDEALVELAGAIDEVASELDALEAQVGQSDAAAAAKIRDAASRLRGLRPDPEPTPEPEQPAEPAPVEGDQPA